jgi:hypothetical protein
VRSGPGHAEVGAVEEVSRWSVCGDSLIAGRCLSCDARRWSRFVHRELVLLTVLVGATVASFFLRYARRRSEQRGIARRQAAAWFEAAQRASRGGNPETAVAGLRRAVSKDPENRCYRLDGWGTSSCSN